MILLRSVAFAALCTHQGFSLIQETLPNGQPLTKDFTTSPLHRFRTLDPNFMRWCLPPTTVLHVSIPHPRRRASMSERIPTLQVSNLPEGTRPEQLAALFGGEHVLAVQMFTYVGLANPIRR